MSLSVYLSSLIIFGLLAVKFIPRRLNHNLKRVGRDPGFLGLNLPEAKREFAANGHRLVDEGYKKFKDGKFLIQTQDMERLVLSSKYLPELRMLPESKLSQSAALVARWLGQYSGVDIILQDRQHSDVCRVQLTHQLPQFLPKMAAELDLSMPNFLAKHTSEDYSPIPAYDFIFSMVLSVSSRVFVSLPLARDQAWLDTVSAYLTEVVATANALRPWPPLLRPLLRPFVAPKRRMDIILADAQKILLPAINERKALEHQQTDLLGFLVQTCEVFDPESIILKLLVLTAAALHTSTIVSVHTLYDLCDKPEYFEGLRAEAQTALDEDAGLWQFGTIKKLRRLDSFMKESMRYNQADALAFNRIVMSPIKLSDGYTLQTGTFINMAGESISRDPSYYESPNSFNGYRFFKHSETNETLPLDEFAGIEPGNLAWGAGRQTCPGRWYASAMNKLIIGSLLVKYEIKFPEGQTKRLSNLYRNGVILPDPTQQLLLRKLR